MDGGNRVQSNTGQQNGEDPRARLRRLIEEKRQQRTGESWKAPVKVDHFQTRMLATQLEDNGTQYIGKGGGR